eukprot:3827233-Pleurochrysis_carterae.AAC.1
MSLLWNDGNSANHHPFPGYEFNMALALRSPSSWNPARDGRLFPLSAPPYGATAQARPSPRARASSQLSPGTDHFFHSPKQLSQITLGECPNRFSAPPTGAQITALSPLCRS